jgi:hypothetical protein
VRRREIVALAGAGALLFAQLARPARENPPVPGDIAAPITVRATLRQACYDCHSNETVWPWYSVIAPISWVVSAHVHDGRRHLNFSEWSEYASDPGTAAEKFKAIAQQTRSRRMPPWYYRVTHPQARLGAAPRDELIHWAEREEADAAASPQ